MVKFYEAGARVRFVAPSGFAGVTGVVVRFSCGAGLESVWVQRDDNGEYVLTLPSRLELV